MAKPFFYRIEAGALLDFATDPDGEKMTLLQFAKALQKGESEIPFIKSVIEETHDFIEKKRLAGASGGKAKASSAKAKASTPLASSSSSSSSSSRNNSSTDNQNKEKVTPSLSGSDEPNPDDFPSPREVIPYQRIANAMNEILKTNYRVTDDFRKVVRARYRDGFKEEDFAEVCRKQLTAWGNAANMVQYLRPSTLFGPKMNNYLGSDNQAARPMSKREEINRAAGEAFLRGENW